MPALIAQHDLFNYEILNKYFYYDESSPTGLRWRINKLDSKGRQTRARADAVAGSLGSQGYYGVGLNFKRLSVAKIIYCLYHKYEFQSENQVDHIDGNRVNNKIDNLRIVDLATNNRNRRFSQKNVGTNEHCVFGKNMGWYAVWYNEGKQYKKYFSSKKYGGSEKARKAAKKFREDKLRELDFTVRHIEQL